MTAITPEEMFNHMHPEMANDNSWLSYCVELESENAALRIRLAETEHLLAQCQEQCDKLAGERNAAVQALGDAMGRMRMANNRAHELEAERDNAVQAHAKMQLQMWAAEYGEEEVGRQRDEARQWARKFKAERDADRKQLDTAWRLRERTRAQLAEARNKVLDEAMGLVEERRRTGGISYNSYAYIRDCINDLKDAAAYPADEISTVESRDAAYDCPRYVD